MLQERKGEESSEKTVKFEAQILPVLLNNCDFVKFHYLITLGFRFNIYKCGL